MEFKKATKKDLEDNPGMDKGSLIYNGENYSFIYSYEKLSIMGMNGEDVAQIDVEVDDQDHAKEVVEVADEVPVWDDMKEAVESAGHSYEVITEGKVTPKLPGRMPMLEGVKILERKKKKESGPQVTWDILLTPVNCMIDTGDFMEVDKGDTVSLAQAYASDDEDGGVWDERKARAEFKKLDSWLKDSVFANEGDKLNVHVQLVKLVPEVVEDVNKEYPQQDGE
jgi:hypothetical protein